MRTKQMLVRSGLTVAAAALPLTLTAVPAAAVNTQITVTANGSTVQVNTTVCTTGGSASLLSSGQVNFTQGRQVPLSGGSSSQSASWSGVSAGTYTVIVVCANGTTAGTQSITVSPTTSPTISATATRSPSPSPTRGIMGGVGGSFKDFSTITYVAGGVLVTTGVVATVWVLRRRSKPHRL
ncbi:hypothetical protein [Streptomyces sporangiiformans]|uniref:Secreted protein n=1 Tax=Streptomyces sporangiiformans TaxID=2315329 RepID=A0A505DNK4_9ACTN|nr:hypothetical protein [Streptomyces sporangiiformans]TPQ22501.1 hypothetical protein FGD71_009595 [Streptomyces sporangiiformans]